MIIVKRKQEHGFGAFGKTELSILEGAIISSFFPESAEITIKELKERINYSYERVNSALKSLTEKKIVFQKKMGRTLVYSLNLDNIYAEIGFNHYMLEREIDFMKKHRNLYNAVKEIRDNQDIWGIILFGSYSKRTETKQSDVDIICISDKKNETEHFVKSLKYKYNINFAPIVLSLRDFPDIKKDNPALWEDLKNYSIVFKGEEQFYYWIYKEDKYQEM